MIQMSWSTKQKQTHRLREQTIVTEGRDEGEREWERQKEEKNVLRIAIIQMSLGYLGFPVKWPGKFSWRHLLSFLPLTQRGLAGLMQGLFADYTGSCTVSCLEPPSYPNTFPSLCSHHQSMGHVLWAWHCVRSGGCRPHCLNSEGAQNTE